jgi:hypothetical protein
VAVALARTRLMAGRYPYYLLADSAEGRKKERELSLTTGRAEAEELSLIPDPSPAGRRGPRPKMGD